MDTVDDFKRVASTLMSENLETVLVLGAIIRSYEESGKDTYTRGEMIETIKNIQNMIKCGLNVSKAEAVINGTFPEISEVLENNFKDIIKER